MNRIAERFETLQRADRKGFIPFVTAGDPSLETTREIVLALAGLGADVVELGVPFSDPMADGPTIQASSQRAVARGVTLRNVIDLVHQIRHSTTVPIVMFSYLNPILKFGIKEFAEAAAKAGVDGVLLTDIVGRESEEIGTVLRRSAIELIRLVAPTTSDERLKEITEKAGGFVYAVSRAGITGVQLRMSSEAETLVKRIRKVSGLPVAVGFGISTREQVEEVWRYADAAVVGSAIVDVIARAGTADPVAEVTRFARSLMPAVANTSTQT
jgi:tryptophan synthase alpha chain